MVVRKISSEEVVQRCLELSERVRVALLEGHMNGYPRHHKLYKALSALMTLWEEGQD